MMMMMMMMMMRETINEKKISNFFTILGSRRTLSPALSDLRDE